MRTGENLFTPTFTSPYPHTKGFALLDKFRCFPDQRARCPPAAIARSSWRRHSFIHLHSLMREKTGMITDLWRKRKKPPVPTVLGERASGGFGPSGAIVSEPESDYQLRRGSRR
jgi:hypothetical protein